MADPLRQTYGEVFFLTSGLQRDPYGLANFHPASNVNRLDIYLEDGVSTNVVMVNFKADGKGYPTSVFFPTLYGGTVQKVITGEASARSFAKYSLLVPPQVLQWNANGTSTLSLQTTVVQTAGDGLLGAFENYTALTTAYPATEDLMDDGSIAYVYTTVGSDEYGFYAVTYDSGTTTYSWTLVDNPVTQINMVDTKQYNIVGMQIQKGNLPRPTSTVTISDEYIRYILAYISTVNDNCNLNKQTLDDHEIRITALETDVDAIIAGTQDITFNNTISGLVATTLKGAVDEVAIAISNMKDGTDPFTKLTLTDGLGNTEDITYASKLALDGRVGDLETANMVKSIAVVGTHLFTLTFYDGTTSNILTLAELKAFIGEATQSLSGLMSATDKTELDTLVALFDSDADDVVNTIAEVLAIFSAYPEGVDLVTALAGKVDKTTTIAGVDLADNITKEELKIALDIDDAESRLDTAESDINDLEQKDVIQDSRINQLEENLRKSYVGDSAVASGTDIISLGKDVANAPLNVLVEGGLLDSPNTFNLTTGTLNGITYTISGNQITLSGTASAETTLTLASGLTASNKAYVNLDYISGTSTGVITLKNGATSLNATYNADYSGVVTLEGTTITLVIASGAVLTSVIYKANINKVTVLISNKQYSPIYDTTFDLMSDAQIKAQMDAWVQDGTLPNDIMAVSMDKRVRSVGKNLFDGVWTNPSSIGITYTKIGNNQFTLRGVSGTGVNAVNVFPNIKFKNDTRYTFTGSSVLDISGTNTRLRVLYTDGTLADIFSPTTTLTSFSFTSASGKTIQSIVTTYSNANGITTVSNFQLELGSTATTYQPYISSDLYLQSGEVGYHVRDVRDTIEMRNGKVYYIKRVALDYNDVVQNATNWTVSTDLGSYRLFVKDLNLLLYKIPTATSIIPNIKLKIGTTEYTAQNQTNATGSDTLGVGIATNGNFLLKVLKTDLFTVDSAGLEAYLQANDVSFYYELATPIETEILAIGNAQGIPNATVYIDDIKWVTDIYTTNITVDTAISQLVSITKMNADGSETQLAVSGATVAGDGLSFTHSSLSSGDAVRFTYIPQGDYFKSNTDILYFDNPLIVVDSVTSTVYKIIFTIANGVITVGKVAV